MCTDCPSALASDPMSAFPQMVAHHQDLVYGIARRWTAGSADAEDVSQEAFLRAYRALSGYAPERIAALHLRGWLARITLNLAHDRARDGGPATVVLDEGPDRADEGDPGPERAAIQRESALLWRRLLGGLPDRYRQAVGLRHIDGLSYPELAEALGRPLGTVKSDVHRGVRLLRRAYETEAEMVGRRLTHEADGPAQRMPGAAMRLAGEVSW